MTNEVYKSIQKHEGLQLNPYRCTAGKLTIGYGRNLDDNGISKEEADEMLSNDVKKINDQLHDKIDSFRFFDDRLQDILIEMAYQMGVNGLLQFKKMLHHLSNFDLESASIEMLDSKWAKQTPNRAKELANLMKGGN